MKLAAKITAIAAMAVAGMAEARVPVCWEDKAVVPAPIMIEARGWATMMFRGAGVGINWTCSNAPDSRFRTSLVIRLLSHAPDGYKPGAMAYALPYEGVHIVVFYDRIEVVGYQRTAAVLACVLVHEITHILQGGSSHSETGVMKAIWGSDDYARMQAHQLTFVPEDIEMIKRGLAARESRQGVLVAAAGANERGLRCRE
jgi:hypothetical protein